MIRAALIGVTVGATFTAGALVADLLARRRHSRSPWFDNPDDFLTSLTRRT